MRTRLDYTAAGLVLLSFGGMNSSIRGAAQANGPIANDSIASDSVRLEVTAEVASTDVDGYPAAIRIELKNAGSAAVDLPMAGIDCTGPGGAVFFQFRYEPSDGTHGKGFGCVSSLLDGGPFLERVRTEWLRVAPGEYLAFTENTRRYFNNLGPGRVEYWVEYIPPELSAKEKAELREEGYLFPKKLVTTPHTKLTID